MKDEAYWREEIMKALATEDFSQEGRKVFVRMRDEGIGKQIAYDLILKMLREGDGILTEDEDDNLRELSSVVYGHCAPSFRVWD